ncbi:glycerol-3-phosphate dehydrogenase/oxidase [Herbiconiux sp. SYSU D00978]|uniref:glycerol-3-phosphate dehydrogenase/oxidase n=1 Tax=Herbiconiux sp. SYSU D00978 TaxID=2812562 RepID=UPI001A959A21|nr:glycerol-3-phosphate dehydrogenase/oxidase [Herbiconiux sp. SYSU D00978]
MSSNGDSTGTTRADVRALQERPTADVVIIGGGINGISTFRELAMQGLDVVLVERNDFASGASAASSHMIHGGIRYLENGEFRLVKEGVQERNALLRSAPHFVKPLETTIPINSTFSGILAAPLRFLTHKQGKPKERGALLIKVGLTLYDTFSRSGGVVPRHRFHGRRKSLAALPKLDPHFRYTATYFDASMHDPERLALDVLRDGLEANPKARAVNYVEAVGLDAEGVRLRDRESGVEFTVRGRAVVNTSGPWTDLTNTALGNPTKYMGGTKGSHIVLDNPELLRATAGREIFFEHDDGRIVLIYPFKGRVLVGTTDIDADPREPARCTPEEVQYFFELIEHVFPTVPVSEDQIVFRFSGIRPLPTHEDTQPGFVSRDYRIERAELAGTPVFSLVGGKWTTFRALGEHLADKVLAQLGVQRTVSTRRAAIGGGKDYPTDAKAWQDRELAAVAPERRAVLFARYGTRAASVARRLTDETPLLGGAISEAELRYMVDEEHVTRLTDVLLRRTDLAFTGRVDHDALETLGRALANAAGWDEFRLDREIEEAAQVLELEHGVTGLRMLASH